MAKTVNIILARSGFNAFYSDWRDALISKPNTLFEGGLNQLFQDLDDQSVLGVSPSNPTGRVMQWIFLLGNWSEEAGLKNLIDPTWDATNVSGLTFVQGVGYQGDSSGYINTNSAAQAPHSYLAVSDAHHGSIVSNWGASNVAVSRGRTNSANRGYRLRPKQANNNNIASALQNNSFKTWGTVGDPTGMHITVREDSSTTRKHYFNGSLFNTVTAASLNTTLAGTDSYILARNKIGTGATNLCSSGQTVNLDMEGLQMTALQAAGVTQAFKDYFDTIGIISPIP